MNSEIAYALDILGIRPQTWDIGGWAKLTQKYRLMDILNLDDPRLPESSKEFMNLVSDYRESLKSEALAIDPTLNADDYGKPTWNKEYEAWILACEHAFFPAYVDAINLLTKRLLSENFKFKYAKDGTPIVYCRVQDAEGTLWEEVGDGEHPFSTLQGKLRRELEKTLVASTKAKEVDVYYSKDGETHYATNIPYYKLYTRFKEDFLSTVNGSAENVAKVRKDFLDTIDTLKRQHEGNLTKAEIEGGMHKVAESLAEMDDKLNSFTFLYDKDFKPADLTNDPNVDAFSYFNLDTLVDGPTPDFDGFLDAVVPECRESLMAAIYATVYAPSQLNQYIWLHGEGGDGKSSFLNALRQYLGDNLACSLGQTMNSDFGLENAIGKRMVILSDVKTGLSVKSQLIHNLTGHDAVSINRKNKPIITTVLSPIVWIAANESPDVNFDVENESRRCLYIKMRTPSKSVLKKFSVLNEDGSFKLDSRGNRINNGYNLTAGLVKEMPSILYKCREVFFRVSPPPYSVIVQPAAQHQLAVTECVDTEADAWLFYLNEAFEFGGEDVMPLPEVMEAVQDVRNLHGEKGALSNFQKRDIKRLLVNTFHCRLKKVNGYRKLVGLKRKDNV